MTAVGSVSNVGAIRMPSMPEGREQAVVDDGFVGPPGDLLDEQAEQAEVQVGVRVVGARRCRRAARDRAYGREVRARAVAAAEEGALVRREPAGVRQQLAHRDRVDPRVGDLGADELGEAAADGVVEAELAGLDELQHDDRR